MNNIIKSNFNKKHMNKKYTFTNKKKTLPNGAVVHQIKALRNFGNVKKGDLGGWIETEDNLSHDKNCWVFGEACVFGKARVFDCAQIYDNAIVQGFARIYGSSEIYGNAEITGDACIYDCARVYGSAIVRGSAMVQHFACVYGNACVEGSAYIENRSRIYGRANVWNAHIRDSAKVCGKTYIFDSTIVGGQAKVGGGNKIVRIYGGAVISGNAVIKCTNDYSVFKNTWTPVDNDGWGPGRYFTYTASNKMWRDAGFSGTGKELVANAKLYSKLSEKCYSIIVKAMEDIEKAKAEAK